MENKRPPVQSIDRLFDIIEVLSEHPRGMALTDLACRAGLHASTTHRLLASLYDQDGEQEKVAALYDTALSLTSPSGKTIARTLLEAYPYIGSLRSLS